MPVRASARIRAANHQAQQQLHNVLGAVNAAVGNIDGVIQHVGADLRNARRQEQGVLVNEDPSTLYSPL